MRERRKVVQKGLVVRLQSEGWSRASSQPRKRRITGVDGKRWVAVDGGGRR
jgi:hypothetical protein